MGGRRAGSYLRVMETASDPLRPPTEADVAEAVDRLVRAMDPLRIDVFGSVASGTAGPGSDLDLLVVFEHLDRADKRTASIDARTAIGSLGVAVDVVSTSPGEIERRGHIIGTVLREAIEGGRTVYSRPSRHGA